MSKKRVHEIAKELKAAGIELDNKEVVNELVALGYDVKSHSSSLEDDQANSAIQKIIEKRKPKAAAPAVAPKGFVVRKRTGLTAVMTPAPGAPAPGQQPPPLAPEEVREELAPVAEAKAAPQPAEVARPPAPSQTPEPEKRVEPVEEKMEPAPEPPPAKPAEPARPRPSAPEPRPAMAARSNVPVPRPSAPRQGPVPPAGSGRTSPTAPGAPITQHSVDPRQLRPTPTQAVVISRPAVAVRRVTPSSTAHKQIPLAPGRKAIGEVREFKVVPDQLGRGREFVDVSKGKESRPKKRAMVDKEGGSFSQQDIKELIFGRVAIPVRGKKKKPTKKGMKTPITEMAEEKKVIRVQEGITVADLSQRMGVKTAELIKKLMQGGTMATANHLLDPDTAGIIAADYGWKVEKVGFEVEDFLPEIEDRPEDMQPRPPVVTVMGHVDHGKTSLLDAIRQANVAAGEAGGITQHIGAYTVRTEKGEITFIDTPGHEAFTAMRERGANVTDIVVLVVAANDGVMPQTIEAINHAKKAEVPMVVAINKMDAEGANPDRVKKQLADQNVLAEDWGGDVIVVPVSAKTKQGIELLLENILLQAEVLELKANPNRPAVGAIVEAKLEKGRGPVATVLVQEGTLKQGDPIVAGTHHGRVRAMVNDKGEAVKELPPGHCAEIIGLSGVPTAGDTLHVVADEKAAKEIAEHRQAKERAAELSKQSAKESLDQLFAKMKQAEGQKELKLVVKADTQGSLEAVAMAVEKMSTRKVKVSIVDQGVGAMTESDVQRAAASKGHVVGFNVKPESGAEAEAKAQGVQLQSYQIIYELLDGVKAMMEGLLEPIRTEKKLGRAEVRNIFNVPKLGTIAGAAVIDGAIKRTALVRLLRDSRQIHLGRVASLKRFKDDVREVEKGFECGIGIENYQDIKPGDIIEAFEIEETRPSLN